MRGRQGAIAFVFLLAEGVAGCGEPDRPVRPSGPVSVTSSETPLWDGGTSWTLSPEPVLEVSREQRVPEEQFSHVTAAVRLPGGRLVVADDGLQELRFFGPDGRFLDAVSGPGDAPGEFRGLDALYVFRHDSLVAYDAVRGRVSVFDADGRFHRSLGLDGAVSGHAVGVSDKGWIVVVGQPSMSMEMGLHGDSASMVVYDLASGQPDTIGSFLARERFVTRKGGSRSMGERPFGRVLSAAISRDRLVVGTGAPFEILVVSRNGQVEASIQRTYTPMRVTARHRDRYVDWRTARFRGAEEFTQRARDVLSSNATPYPETLLAYDRILADEGDHLWVRHYRPPWEGAGRSWSVFDPEGRWLGVVANPAGFELLQVGADFVVGVMHDELDVQRVRVYRLHKGGG